MTDTINKYVKLEDASEHDHPSHTWTLGAVYQVGDWVWNDGVTFKVKVAHTATAELEPILPVVQGAAGANGTNGADGADGAPGAAGTPLGDVVWHGAWSGAHAYISGDGVTYESRAYVCTQGHTNQVPPNITYWAEISSGAVPVRGETPSGECNGSNKVFTLAHTPDGGVIDLFINGLCLTDGAAFDYTLSGVTITLTDTQFAPNAANGDRIRASYIY